jgi:heptosyltransferase III
MQKNNIRHILLSRTDSIGDVVLTLPMAGVIKQYLPNCKITFLGKEYTRAIVALSQFVDDFISLEQFHQLPISEQIQFIQARQLDAVLHVFPKREISILMKKAQVPLRIGTSSRMHHWFNCNQLIRLSRRHSDLHEAQLNLKLLSALGMNSEFDLTSLPAYYGFTRLPELEEEFRKLLSTSKRKIILHPKSKGSAREWGFSNFENLIQLLPSEKYQLFFSGTKEEGETFSELKSRYPQVIDVSGKMNLTQFIAFINACDGLVAASTGPLHIASALGKKAVGIFAPMRPIHPGRWKPIGIQSTALSIDKNCSDCKSGGKCSCIEAVQATDVFRELES